MSALQTVRGDCHTELKFDSFGTTSPEGLASLSRSHRPDAVPIWRRYSLAAGCVLFGFLVRYLLTPILGEELTFLLFIAAALVAAWYGGAVCGLTALALGLLLGDAAFLRSTTVSQRIEVIRFIRYIFTASLGIGLIEILHRSRSRTETMLERLENEVERRKRSEKLLLEAEVKLPQHAQCLERCVGEQTAKLSDTVDSFTAQALGWPLLNKVFSEWADGSESSPSQVLAAGFGWNSRPAQVLSRKCTEN